MKAYLKKSGRYWTGRVSAKGGILDFVMCGSMGRAREFSSIEYAMEYLDSWQCRTVGWQIEVDYGKPERDKPRKFCEPLPPTDSRILPKGIDYTATYCNPNFDKFNSLICEVCGGTGLMFTGESDFLTGHDVIYKVPCEYCNNGLKEDYFEIRRQYLETEHKKRPVCTYSNPCKMLWAEGVGWLHSAPHDESYQKYFNKKSVDIKSETGWNPPPERTITALCKEADNNRDNYHKLLSLYNEATGGNYPRSEREFAMEHIEGYIDELRGRALKENARKRFEDE